MHLVKSVILPAQIVSAASWRDVEPRMTSVIKDFNPSAQSIFAPHHYAQILVSDLGVILWILGVAAAVSHFGFANVFRVYGAPYLWYVHYWSCRKSVTLTYRCRVGLTTGSS